MLPPGMDQQQFDDFRRRDSEYPEQYTPRDISGMTQQQYEDYVRQRDLGLNTDIAPDLPARYEITGDDLMWRRTPRTEEERQRMRDAYDPARMAASSNYLSQRYDGYDGPNSMGYNELLANSPDSMQTIIKLVSDNGKLIKQNKKLQQYAKAQEWVNKRNAKIKRPENKYGLLPHRDYDGDDLKDVIVTKKGGITSFNGYSPKETDWPLRALYYEKHPNVEDDLYVRKKHTLKRDNDLEHLRFSYDPETMYEFSERVREKYPVAKRAHKAQNKLPEERTISVYQAYGSAFVKPAWDMGKSFANENEDVKEAIKIIKYLGLQSLGYRMFIVNEAINENSRFEQLDKSDQRKVLIRVWNKIYGDAEQRILYEKATKLLLDILIDYAITNKTLPTIEVAHGLFEQNAGRLDSMQ